MRRRRIDTHMFLLQLLHSRRARACVTCKDERERKKIQRCCPYFPASIRKIQHVPIKEELTSHFNSCLHFSNVLNRGKNVRCSFASSQ